MTSCQLVLMPDKATLSDVAMVPTLPSYVHIRHLDGINKADLPGVPLTKRHGLSTKDRLCRT
jgi:hypothetical protein